MALTLTDVRRIASDVAQHEDPNLDVVGVTPREGSSTSAEVIFVSRACDQEPCRVVIGVSRRLSEDERIGIDKGQVLAMLVGEFRRRGVHGPHSLIQLGRESQGDPHEYSLSR